MRPAPRDVPTRRPHAAPIIRPIGRIRLRKVLEEQRFRTLATRREGYLVAQDPPGSVVALDEDPDRMQRWHGETLVEAL